MKKVLLAAVLISCLVVCSLVSETFAAEPGKIVGWGEQKTPDEPLTNLTKIGASYGHSLALKSDGSIVGWGWNSWGQATPPAGNDFVAIAAGVWHSLAIKSVPCQFAIAGDLNND